MSNALTTWARRVSGALLPAPLRDLLARMFAKCATDRYHLHKHYVDMFVALRNLKALGFQPASIIDVGAYSGAWSSEMYALYPNSKYLLIEPLQHRMPDAERMTRDGAAVAIERVIAGPSQAAEVPFSEMGQGSSVYSENTPHKRLSAMRPMADLDSLVKKHGLKPEYFLKIDVQGFEIEVLKGATEVLQSANFVLVETSLLNYNKNAPLLPEVVAFFYAKGFVPFDVCNTHRKHTDNVLFQVDMIFAREECMLRKRANDFSAP